MFKHLTSEKHT